jgi:hypothetical protein
MDSLRWMEDRQSNKKNIKKMIPNGDAIILLLYYELFYLLLFYLVDFLSSFRLLAPPVPCIFRLLSISCYRGATMLIQSCGGCSLHFPVSETCSVLEDLLMLGGVCITDHSSKNNHDFHLLQLMTFHF